MVFMTHIIHTDTKYCVVEEIQKHWLRNYLRKKYAKSPNGFAIKYQSVILKSGNQCNSYVSKFSQNQKLQNKNKLCVYFKGKLLGYQSQGIYFLILI